MRKLTIVASALLLLLGGTPASADRPGNPTVLAAEGAAPVLTPDGTTVLHLAPYGSGPERGLYAVAPTGGEPVHLSPELSEGQYVSEFWASPDSSYAVYKVRDPVRRITSLYTVAIDSGHPALLHPPLDDGEHVLDVQISPDSSQVVFSARGSAGDGVFSGPIDGQQPPTTLSPPLHLSGVDAVQISSDSRTVVMAGWNPDTELFNLLATPIAKQDVIKLAEHPTSIWDPLITPDATRVVYKVGPLNISFSLFSVELTGSADPNKLTIAFSDDEGSSADVAISPDSQWIVIRESPRNGKTVLWSVSIDGGEMVPYGMSPAGRISAYHFVFSADSHVLYVGAAPGAEWTDLYREPIGGGDPVMLTATPGSGDGVGVLVLAGDPQLVVYTARAGPASEWDVFTIPATGGTAHRLTNGFDGGLGAQRAGIPIVSPDLRRVVFMARTGETDTFQLYSVPIGGGSTVQLNGSEELSVAQWGVPALITADSARVIYAAHPAGVNSVPIGVECAGHFATIVGTSGADELIGTSGRDIIHGRGGNDLIRGRGGRDVICAGSGADIVYGGRGGDTLIGGSGADQIRGGRGGDILRGKSGADTLNGGRGTDACFGGAGNDTLTRCE